MLPGTGRRSLGHSGHDGGAGNLWNRHHAAFLHYDQARQAGWPIATGVIEGAVRHIVADRLDISGARWGLAGSRSCPELRTVVANGTFSAYWRYHLDQEHHRVHRAHNQYGHHLTE